MNVLISWSNEKSEKIATILRNWLPVVVPDTKPWVSSHDIPKGRRWSHELAVQLSESHFALLVVVKDNQESPWLNFEAGAISKWVEAANVAPLLFGIHTSELQGPITQFQATLFTREDMFKLAETMSKAGCVAPDLSALRRSFDLTWEPLQQDIEAILNEPQSDAAPVTLSREAERDTTIWIDEDRRVILEQIGTSEDNFQNVREITNRTQMKRAKVEHLLSDLTKAEYLSEENVPMIGKCYKVIDRGSKYLIDHGIL